MLEKELIQTRGFHNIYKNGEKIGFQFNVRLTYYRGIFLSQLRPQSVTVDNEFFQKEQLVWSFNGEDFNFEQMKVTTDTHWSPTSVATIKVFKAGGLSEGYHEIKAGYRFSSSYLPPQLQTHIDEEELDPLLSMFFGELDCTKRMLLVM